MVDSETFLGVYSERAVLFLQRMPQVLWLTETLLFIILWKRVYDAYTKAEKINSRVTIGRYKYTVAALTIILLGGGTVTCSLQAANIKVDLMQNIIVGLVRWMPANACGVADSPTTCCASSPSMYLDSWLAGSSTASGFTT